VDAGNTVIVVEHDMRVVAGSDWVIDMGPGAGDEGGRVVVSGTPAEVAGSPESRTGPYLARFLEEAEPGPVSRSSRQARRERSGEAILAARG
jgi:excinuclease ABC subunit A